MTFEEACGIKPKEPESDPVNHPAHYTKHAITLEPIDLLQHLPFCLGNALKYVIRAQDKGNELQDLKKAVFYLERAYKNGEYFKLEKIAVPCLHSDNQLIRRLGEDVLTESEIYDAFNFFWGEVNDRIEQLEQSK